MNVTIPAGETADLVTRALQSVVHSPAGAYDEIHIVEPAKELLKQLKDNPGRPVRLEATSVKGNAVATAIEDFLDEEGLKDSEVSALESILDEF